MKVVKRADVEWRSRPLPAPRPVAAAADLRRAVETILKAKRPLIIAGQGAGVFVALDAKQLIVSLIGIHFMPFAVGNVVQGFIGIDPFDPAVSTSAAGADALGTVAPEAAAHPNGASGNGALSISNVLAAVQPNGQAWTNLTGM